MSISFGIIFQIYSYVAYTHLSVFVQIVNIHPVYGILFIRPPQNTIECSHNSGFYQKFSAKHYYRNLHNRNRIYTLMSNGSNLITHSKDENRPNLDKATIANIINYVKTTKPMYINDDRDDNRDVNNIGCGNEDSTQGLIPSLVKVTGWVQNIRKIKDGEIVFIDINDGTTPINIQIILNTVKLPLKDVTLDRGSAISVTGTLDWRRGSPSQKSHLDVDIYVEDHSAGHEIIIYKSSATGVNPVIPSTRYSMEYLRNYPHLRARNSLISSVFRIRGKIIEFTHQFFKNKHYTCVTTPLLTSTDCEGLGELFKVSIDEPCTSNETPSNQNLTYLSVSGQLELESICCSMGNVWRFGPSFRADRSDTPRHLSEFWMIEMEALDIKLDDMIFLVQEYIQKCSGFLLNDCMDDVLYLTDHNDSEYKSSLERMSNTKIVTLTYTDAVEILNKLKYDDPDAEHPKIVWGTNLSASHERSLIKHFNGSIVAVTHYPEAERPFYMRSSNDTVENFDILAPIVNELVGGSVREERYEKLLNKMRKRNISGDEYDRYLQLRQFGNIPHGGFGIGFERLVMLMTRIQNIKDVIPFPIVRTKHSIH